ncbi:hypothetical protein L195_g019646 [Trifolium pratense]|uniref:Uncharacterized protein n=1 Tax=Trifolium pratense TaxID=57577 RepID=A0A2K3N068_TRIPR|nr:uncharacterized protein LOC123890149 [Trifolium pratense]PNX96440.1 hypothetical protein L195_g019646 [Trifolium pratense]
MHRNFLTLFVLLIILLSFSYVLSSSASPATRSQNLKGEDTSTIPSIAKVDNNHGEEVVLVDKEEGLVERRMDLETQDYDGTGANRDHEPKPPRRV